MKLVISACLLIFFCSPAFAESPSSKRAIPSRKVKSTASRIITRPAPVPNPTIPPKPAISHTRQEVSKPLSLFQVNPPVRITGSNIQVLAGKKDPDSAILISDSEVVPANSFNTWYYEYPLTQAPPESITVSQTTPGARNIRLQSPPIKLADAKTLDSGPYISGTRLEPQSKDIILTIQDPAGVLSYNIYYANTLSSTGVTSPFILAQSDYPVSGTGTTTWRDNGAYTSKHPMDPSIKMRFYELEVNCVDTSTPAIIIFSPQEGEVISE